MGLVGCDAAGLASKAVDRGGQAPPVWRAGSYLPHKTAGTGEREAMNAFARPFTLEQAVAALSDGPWTILAGGTDLYPVAQGGLKGPVLDLSGIAGLRGIRRDGGLRIGACTTWTDLAEAALPPALRALQQAARQVGGRQIQNMGTIGGNLCNASPAADGVPPLLAVDAAVELVGPEGRRVLPLAEFLTGPRQTAKRADEILTAILVPEAALAGRSTFVKLGARAYLVISIAMVAARVVVEGGQIRSAALAVGACSATARRVPGLEAALIGLAPNAALAAVTEAAVAAHLAPIDDIRASAAYRAGAAAELLRRALAEVLG